MFRRLDRICELQCAPLINLCVIRHRQPAARKMPAPTIDIPDIRRAVHRYNQGDRPWRQTLNRVDWFLIFDGELYPLKYTYALAVNEPPANYTTNQMKYAMKHLGVTFHSLKAESDDVESFLERVRMALANPKARRKRLREASSRPQSRYVTTLDFARNPDVVAEVLERANGHCEACGNPAPFLRAADNTPYLEVHHKIMLADGGPDTVENAEALCPNCHRRKHFGAKADS